MKSFIELINHNNCKDHNQKSYPNFITDCRNGLTCDDNSEINKEIDTLKLDILNLKLDDIWNLNDNFEWETLSYFITEKLKRFPKTWEIIPFVGGMVDNQRKPKTIPKPRAK